MGVRRPARGRHEARLAVKTSWLAHGRAEAHTEVIAEIILFHHAQGLTEGLRRLADRLRTAGHVVHTPDMYSGRTFSSLDEGLAFASRIGHDAIEEIARRAARQHPDADTTMGFSLGAFPAQLLAQEWGKVRQLVLVAGGMPPRDLQGDWRSSARLCVHVADPDDWIPRGSLALLLRHAPEAQVHRYRGLGHMFVDPSSPDYDADAAELFEERLLTWLMEGDALPHP